MLFYLRTFFLWTRWKSNTKRCFYFIGKFPKEPSSCTKSDCVKKILGWSSVNLTAPLNTPGVMESLSKVWYKFAVLMGIGFQQYNKYGEKNVDS